MKPGIFQLLTKVAAPEAHPEHEQFLDEHFSISPQWKAFKKKLRSKTFVESVQHDSRSDERLKRYSEANAKHVQARGVPSFKVPSASSSKWHTIKYHPDIDRFSCNCGDWVHKKSWDDHKDCKHIKLVKSELQQQGINTQDLVKQAAFGLAAAKLAKG